MAGTARVVTLIPVKKMDRAIEFYTKKLGAKIGDRGMGEMKDFWAEMSLGGCDFWFVAPEKQEKRKLAYTTLLVKNIKSYVGELKRKGVKFDKAEKMSPETKIDGPIATEQFGASAFFKDTEGNLWMVWQNFPPM